MVTPPLAQGGSTRCARAPDPRHHGRAQVALSLSLSLFVNTLEEVPTYTLDAATLGRMLPQLFIAG